MPGYTQILVAVDLTDEAPQVIERAAELAKLYGAELTILHVIEPLTFAYGGDIPMDLSGIQTEIEAQAKAKVAGFAESLGVPGERQLIIYGRPENEIHRAAEQRGIDLIILGSHGRHGFSLLLGSTANGVLHGASCDVLAVRVQASEN